MKSNWYIITGAPCAGKTTTIELLKEKGYTTTEETARMYFHEQIAKGISNEEIRKDPKKLQESILQMQLDLEAQFKPEDLVFFDRALPDSLGYFNYHHLVFPDLTLIQKEKYNSVFFLDRVPSKADTIRNESEEELDAIEKATWEAYTSLGFSPITVPFMTQQQRVEFILNHVESKKSE